MQLSVLGVDRRTALKELMIAWRDIIRGAARRFLPAAVVTALVFDAPNWILAGFQFISLAPLVASLGGMVGGYVAVLGSLRSHLRDDADVAGDAQLLPRSRPSDSSPRAALCFEIGRASCRE